MIGQKNPPKTEDQPVNGVAIVAAILNRISKGKRERLIQSIEKRRPEITTQLKAQILEFEQLAQLSQDGMQTLVKQVEQKDIAISLKGADQTVSHSLLRGLTARQRQQLHDNLAQLNELTPEEIEEAQQRVLGRLADLQEAGEIKAPPKRGVYI